MFSLRKDRRSPHHEGAIVIPAGVRLAQPIRLMRNKQDTSAITHTVILLEKGSRTTVIEEFCGHGSHVTEITLEDGAHLEYVSLGLWGPVEKFRIRQMGSVGAGAMLIWNNVTLGGGDVDHELVSTVNGPGGKSEVNWMFRASGADRLTLSVRNVFAAREGRGEVVIKGVAEDQAQAKASGEIRIAEGGGGTQTHLTQHVLMLDATAKVDAIPALEIKTNDVKASHGATVARVTPEDLFYFASRGIPEAEARRMYTEGFLADLTVRISDEQAREVVRRALEERGKRKSQRR